MKYYRLLVLVMLVLTSCTSKNDGYQILGQIDGIDRAQVKLRGYVAGKMVDIDSTFG